VPGQIGLVWKGQLVVRGGTSEDRIDLAVD
jgi:hypothetical protein